MKPVAVIFAEPTYGGVDEGVVALPFNQGRCTICNKVFKSLTSTRRHVKAVHEPPVEIECCFCHKVTQNVYAFRSHINLTHGISGVKDVVKNYGKILS